MGHAEVGGEEAETVVSVDEGDDGGDFFEGRYSGGREDVGADAGYVGGDPVYAVGVDAAEVGQDKGVGYYCCVGGGDAVAD